MLRRIASLSVLCGVLLAASTVCVLTACSSSQSARDSALTPVVAQEPSPAEVAAQRLQQEQDEALAKQKTKDLKVYLKDNFGGGYGQKPVSWYSAIKSVSYDTPDYLVIRSSLSLKSTRDLESIKTALSYYEGTPSSVLILGKNDVDLFETP